MEWSLAMIKDWISMNPVLRVSPIPSWTDMVMTRGRQPNIICTHPRKHKDPFTGSQD